MQSQHAILSGADEKGGENVLVTHADDHEDDHELVRRRRLPFSTRAVEGLSLKAKLTIRKAYGFKAFDSLQIVFCHTLGNLPESPNGSGRFC